MYRKAAAASPICDSHTRPVSSGCQIPELPKRLDSRVTAATWNGGYFFDLARAGLAFIRANAFLNLALGLALAAGLAFDFC